MKRTFDSIFDVAQMMTTCNKVAVGARFVTGNKEIDAWNSSNGDYNCAANNNCYKAEVTGIYESCEETRKHCKAIHSEVNLINSPKFKKLKPSEIEAGTLYVTRYPCLNCMKEIAKAGIKIVNYCGKQPVSEEVLQIANENGISLIHYSDYDYEDRLKEDWWTIKMYNEAYETIPHEEKYPIIIPSYNRPKLKSVNEGYLSRMTPESNYPIFIFVRESQKEEYKKYLKNPYAKLISMPDNKIDSAGAVRRESLKWLHEKGFKAAFSFDDDLQDILFTYKQFTEKGEPKAGKDKERLDIARILAMWQVSMEKAREKFPGMAISGIYPQSFGWKPEYCMKSQSILLYRGNINQAVCLSVDVLVNNDINYRDNRDCGHEDIDLILQCLEKDLQVCTFPFINYGAPAMDVGNFQYFGSTMKERFKKQQEIMYNNWKDCEWVIFRNKRDLDQVVINFRKYRESKEVGNYVMDLFE